MTQKQFEKHFKKEMMKLSNNMCVTCKHNATCDLPLHGHYSNDGDPCPHAEHIPQEQMLLWVMETFYGPAIREKMWKTQ